MKLKMILKNNNVKIKYSIFLVCLIGLISCKVATVAKPLCPCPVLVPVNFFLVFETGFKDTPLQIDVNGRKYYYGKVTTDKSMDLAKIFKMNSDTIQSLSIKISSKEGITICPSHVTSVNIFDGNVTISSYKDLPRYE